MEQTTWNLIRNAFLTVYYSLTFLFLENFHFMQFLMSSLPAVFLEEFAIAHFPPSYYRVVPMEYYVLL